VFESGAILHGVEEFRGDRYNLVYFQADVYGGNGRHSFTEDRHERYMAMPNAKRCAQEFKIFTCSLDDGIVHISAVQSVSETRIHVGRAMCLPQEKIHKFISYVFRASHLPPIEMEDRTSKHDQWRQR
jgi:hypothetical protein